MDTIEEQKRKAYYKARLEAAAKAALTGLLSNPYFFQADIRKYHEAKGLTLEKIACASGALLIQEIDTFDGFESPEQAEGASPKLTIIGDGAPRGEI